MDKIKKISILLISISFSTYSNAQQILNLDFEKTSIEGLSRPWGWEFDNYANLSVLLDTIVVMHGNYSLKISNETSSQSGEQELTFFLEPYELLGKNITLSGWIKADRFDGSASLLVNYYLGNDTTNIEIASNSVDSSTDWLPVSLETLLPENAVDLSLSVRFKGSGTVWFDNIMLKAEEQNLKELKVTSPFEKSQIDWLKTESSVINSVDATLPGADPDFSDLAELDEIVGDARIIALGESTHGTSEFFRLKNRILEYSVKNLGVRVFAIEDHQLVVNRVNRYVLGGEGTARSSMDGMLGVWQTEEVRDLIQWVRNYNDAHLDDKVEFMGFDIQNAALPIDSAYSFAERYSSDLYETTKMLLADLRQNSANSYLLGDSTKHEWYLNSSKVYELFLKNSIGWLSNAATRVDSLEIIWGLQYAGLVKQYAENTFKGHTSLYRDVAMSENISWIIDVYKPGVKAVIWAHDVHVSRGDHSDQELNIYYGKSMGSHLSRKYGNNYKSFGLFTYQGEYSCYISYTNFTVTDCPLYESPIGSLDEALHRIAASWNVPGLLLNLTKSKSLEWLTKPIPVRFANHVNIEYGYWTRYSIPYQFDGVFFIDKTSSAKSYARK